MSRTPIVLVVINAGAMLFVKKNGSWTLPKGEEQKDEGRFKAVKRIAKEHFPNFVLQCAELFRGRIEKDLEGGPDELVYAYVTNDRGISPEPDAAQFLLYEEIDLPLSPLDAYVVEQLHMLRRYEGGALEVRLF